MTQDMMDCYIGPPGSCFLPFSIGEEQALYDIWEETHGQTSNPYDNKHKVMNKVKKDPFEGFTDDDFRHLADSCW